MEQSLHEGGAGVGDTRVIADRGCGENSRRAAKSPPAGVGGGSDGHAAVDGQSGAVERRSFRRWLGRALIALQETLSSYGAWYVLRADDDLSPVRMMSAQRRSA